MRSIKLTFLLLFSFLIMVVTPAAAFHYQDSESGADFILVGVGVLRQNLTSVDGDEVLFEESDRGLPLDYSNRSFLSLYGEGDLNSTVSFNLDAHYDQEDPDQEFTFLLSLYNDNDDYLIVGDHEYGSFLDTVFTAADDQMRGLTLHGENQKVSGTVIAGAVRGESITDEIRGDGTSGRYRLSEAPVVRGSERIRIEVRDRTSPTRVLNTTSQLRGRDYTIDYDRGEILFTAPVEESDFRGNPVYIVVSYQYDTPGGLYKRSRYGARTTFSPSPSTTIGTTYLADGPWDGDFNSELFDERQQIYGGDITVNLDNRHLIGLEVARSEVPVIKDGYTDMALRADFSTRPTEKLTLFGNYWRVGKDFLTFGNRDLASGNVISQFEITDPFFFKSRSYDFDLDPNIATSLSTDMESFGFSGAYDYNFHTIAAGFRKSRDNIPSEDGPTNYHDTFFTSVTRLDPEGTDYIVGTEVFFDSADGDEAINDSRTARLIGGARHTFYGIDWTGPLTLQAVYQFEQFDDQEQDEDSTKNHDFLARIEIEPITDLLFYGEQGVNFLYENQESSFTERSDVSLLGFLGTINRYFELEANLKYRSFHNISPNELTRSKYTADLKWISQPLDSLRTQLRLEYYRDESHTEDTIDTKHLIGGDIWWDITPSLLLTTHYSHDFNKSETVTTDESDGYDDIMLRLDWRPRDNVSFFGYYRMEYDLFDVESLSSTRVLTTTELLGAKYRFIEQCEFVTAYRRKVLHDDADNDKIKVFAELAYDINQYLAVAPGYEYNTYTEDETSETYEAHVFYISLIGKL